MNIKEEKRYPSNIIMLLVSGAGRKFLESITRTTLLGWMMNKISSMKVKSKKSIFGLDKLYSEDLCAFKIENVPIKR